MLPNGQTGGVVSGRPDAHLRASDAERERTLVTLREAAAEGRLTFEELEARTADALEARTRGALDGLSADLPARPGRSRPPDGATRRRPRRSPREELAVYAAVNLLLIVVWAATGAGYFWPIWPLLGWGIGIAQHARAGGIGCNRRPHHPTTRPRRSA